MRLERIWRYPVKSMAGELLHSVELGPLGLAGDRRVAVVDPAGPRPRHPLTAREIPELLSFAARWESGEAVVSGPGLASVSHRDPAAAAALSEHMGRRLELLEVEEPAMDDSPVHAVHLAWVCQLEAELGAPVDPRRFRANLYLGGTGPAPEGSWPGRRLRAGSTALDVVSVCRRCALTTRDPAAPAQSWPRLLRHLVERRAEILGVYLRTAVPGVVSAGMEVRLD
jgi:uncharacterized protein YcbX